MSFLLMTGNVVPSGNRMYWESKISMVSSIKSFAIGLSIFRLEEICIIV